MADPTNGEKLEITDSLGRKIELKTLGPADLLNLLEAAGNNSGNSAWMRLAMELASVRKIDELPLPFAVKKDQLMMVANKLGNEGLAAVHNALFPPAPESEGDDAESAAQSEAETAKN